MANHSASFQVNERSNWCCQTKCTAGSRGSDAVGRRYAPRPQACQSVSLLQLLAGGDPAGGHDVCPLPTLAPECGRPAVRARDPSSPRDRALLVEPVRPAVRRRHSSPRVSRMRVFRRWKWHLEEMYVIREGAMVTAVRLVMRPAAWPWSGGVGDPGQSPSAFGRARTASGSPSFGNTESALEHFSNWPMSPLEPFCSVLSE